MTLTAETRDHVVLEMKNRLSGLMWEEKGRTGEALDRQEIAEIVYGFALAMTCELVDGIESEGVSPELARGQIDEAKAIAKRDHSCRFCSECDCILCSLTRGVGK